MFITNEGRGETPRGLAAETAALRVASLGGSSIFVEVKHRLSFVVAAVVVALLSVAPAPAAQDEVLPLVELENVRLPDAIPQFARTARLNVILDPRLSAPPFNEMTVSVRWENVTAKEALLALLENYGLVMVETGRGK